MKYIVGFSGGTDSVFVALTLKQAGHEVLLVNLKNTKEKNKCCSLPTELMEVASFLDLPLKIIDATKDFRELVIEDFVKTYLKGNTPNPCINCNENVRFQMLEKYRQEIGYDKVSTGHYVKKLKISKLKIKNLDDLNGGNGELKMENGELENQSPKFPEISTSPQSGNPEKILKSGENPEFYTFAIPEDKKKDQTYMLYRLAKHQDIVKNLDFPIADYTKEEVKKIINENHIPINTSQESQNICFIPDDDYPRFIKQAKNIQIPSGKIVDVNGNYMGEHKGLIFYTIGQRKGLNLNTNEKKYVVDLDWENNILVVGDNKDLFKNKVDIVEDEILFLEGINYDFDVIEQLKAKYGIEKVYGKIRYKGDLQELDRINSNSVIFKEPVRAVTRGQHLVIYGEKDGEVFVIGGGEII